MKITYTLKNGSVRSIDLSENTIEKICGNYAKHTHVRTQVEIMISGISGMIEHPYMSRDWCANNHMFATTHNGIAKKIGPDAAREIFDRIATKIGRRAYAAASR
jgi:hypothetical protein